MSADPRPLPATITLGSKTWTVRPLTLRQVEALEPLVARGSGESPFAYGLAVVSAALARDHEPDIAGLRDLEATSADLAEATRTVLILAGYLREPTRGKRGRRRAPPRPRRRLRPDLHRYRMVPRRRRRADALGRSAALSLLVGHPPVHELVAAFLGVKAQADPPPLASAAGTAADDPSGIGAMILRFPDGR